MGVQGSYIIPSNREGRRGGDEKGEGNEIDRKKERYQYGDGSRDSSVGIATHYGLEDYGGGSSRPDSVKKFSLLRIVQTGSGVHPTSYKMGTAGSIPGVKRQGREADHSPPTSAEVKKMWNYTSTPLYVFMA
jgi:hypothetical protein